MTKISTTQVLKGLYVLSWIIFIGICIEAGGFIVNAFFGLVKPTVVKYLWKEVDLSDLLYYDRGYFFTLTLIMSIVAVLKAWLFYRVIKILHDKKLNMVQPFNNEMGRFIFTIAYVALLIGLFSGSGVKYAEWLVRHGVTIPDMQYLRLGGADVWLFMSVTLFVIAQIFKKGIDIQTENELTV